MYVCPEWAHDPAGDDVGNAAHPPANFKMRRAAFAADNASATRRGRERRGSLH